MENLNKGQDIHNPSPTDQTNSEQWWKNAEVVAEMQRRYNNWQSGKEKGYTLDEIIAEIARLKK